MNFNKTFYTLKNIFYNKKVNNFNFRKNKCIYNLSSLTYKRNNYLQFIISKK